MWIVAAWGMGMASAAPVQVAQQVRLLDGQGSPLDGPHDVVVTLWADATSTSVADRRWTDTFDDVLFRDGFASVALGEPSGASLDGSLFAASLWVGLGVDGGAELAPRTPIHATPVAALAADATRLGGVAASQYARASRATTGPAVDWSVAATQSLTLANGANTLTFSNASDGGVYRLIVRQPASGAAGTIPPIGWPSTVAWPSGTRPTLTPTNGAVDVLTFLYDGAVGQYYGSAALNLSSAPMLAYAGTTHAPSDCTSAGGVVTAVTGDPNGTQVCRFELATCPSGWSPSGWRQWAARLGAAYAEQLTVVGPCTFITYQNGCNHPTKRFDIPASAWGLNQAPVSCTTSNPVNTCDGACYGGACITPIVSDALGAVGCF